jgi:hypothetical protein
VVGFMNRAWMKCCRKTVLFQCQQRAGADNHTIIGRC